MSLFFPLSQDIWSDMSVNCQGIVLQMIDAERSLALANSGFDVNAKDDAGNSFLAIVAYQGHTETARALLARGADPDAMSNSGRPAIAFAAHFGYEKIVDLLLAAGANPDIADKNGVTPLMHAANREWSAIARKLILHGADFDAQDNKRQMMWDYIIARPFSDDMEDAIKERKKRQSDVRLQMPVTLPPAAKPRPRVSPSGGGAGHRR